MKEEYMGYFAEQPSFSFALGTNALIEYARKYVKLNRNIDPKVIDIILINAINYFGMLNETPFILTTEDLHNNKRYFVDVDTGELLYETVKVFANYIFEEDMVNQLLSNYTISKKVHNFVLVDFINFIARENNYSKVFNLKDLYDEHQFQKHLKDMYELRIFLEYSGKYYEQMKNGESIESIYEKFCIVHELKNISSTGTYNYTDESRKKYGRYKMYPWEKIVVEKELYAISYAYAKLYGGNKHMLKIPSIKQKIREMKR